MESTSHASNNQSKKRDHPILIDLDLYDDDYLTDQMKEKIAALAQTMCAQGRSRGKWERISRAVFREYHVKIDKETLKRQIHTYTVCSYTLDAVIHI